MNVLSEYDDLKNLNYIWENMECLSKGSSYFDSSLKVAHMRVLSEIIG